jgi:Putative regulator of cell autolysis
MQTINVIVNTYNIIITFILMAYQLTGKRLKVRVNRLFVYMCACNIIMILGDMLAWLFEGLARPWYPVITWWATLIYYIAPAPLLLLFVHYIAEHVSEKVKVSIAMLRLLFVLMVIYITGIILSQPHGLVYYFDEHNRYVRGEWFLMSQLIPLVIYLIMCILIVAFRKYIRRKVLICAIAYMILPAIAEIVQAMYYGIALIGSAITLNLLLIFIYVQSERELLTQKREKELAESRIDIMLSQINPHFLYNSLTSIRQLCDLDPKAAKESIRDFAYFLRSNMDSLTNKAPIPFTQELEHVKHYLNLEKQRFRERLEVVYDIQAEDFSVPPLSIQPIAENAAGHGIFKKIEGGVVTIKSEETKSAYVVTITDTGIGFDENAPILPDMETHIGIANVRSRLHLMSNGMLEIESEIGKGTVATITIPKESEEDI